MWRGQGTVLALGVSRLPGLAKNSWAGPNARSRRAATAQLLMEPLQGWAGPITWASREW